MFASIAIGDLFAAGEVAFIMALGAILEDKTTQRARKGLENLIRLSPQQGRRLEHGTERLVPVEQLQPGDLLRVLPGESFPADGTLVRGTTSVDQSIITGESLPVDLEPGDTIFCGTLNRFGTVEMKATHVGQDSSLEKLIRLVEDAEKKKAPMQRLADRCASWLVPVALLIAVAAWLLTDDLIRGVTVLVVFCPCALVLATPTAIMAAIGQATRHGVIIKSGEALERMGSVDTIAFDKTGTLTKGQLSVSDILSFSPTLSEDRLLYLTASAETYSEHPLGKAIVTHARTAGMSLESPQGFQMTAGRGISAQVAGTTLLCGSDLYLQGQGISLPDSALQALNQLRLQGKAVLLVAVDGVCSGAVALSDVLRPEAPNAIAQLSAAGVNTLLLTGDNRRTADYFARQLGLSAVESELLPEDKVQHIALLLQQGHRVCMIGDGVNDAPALMTATVGVAMGCMGSDIAVDAADIALMSDDLSRLPYLKRLSTATVHTIQGSITLSLVINFFAILASILGLLTPTTGALVHNAGSVLVVLLAALLYDRKF